jgi:CheY-like chemotaxis protein
MPPKLLLADDSITVQRVIALTFSGEGLEVVTVGDGDRAVERIAADQPEIVLADVSMPGRDGYAVAEFVKRSPEHAARTRVVLLTGAFEPVDENRTRALGIDGVLAKPFEPQMAIGLVKRLLEQAPVQPSEGVERAADSAIASTHPSRGSEWSGALGERSALGAGSGMAAGYPFEPRAEVKETSAELDDYFRRLDEALATAGLAPPPGEADLGAGRSHEGASAAAESAGGGEHAPPSAGGEEMPIMEPPTSNVDMSTPDEPSTLILPAPVDAAASPSEAVASPNEALASNPPQSGSPSLADTFAALLAVEQGEPGATVPTWTPPAPTTESDALIEAVTRRVIDRITDATVREIVNARVLDVAERLVREEIERIKAQAEAE